MPLAELPPASPALTVHQAAANLRHTAQAALADLNSDSFWSCYDRATAWRDGFENGMGGACSRLAAVFTPELALEIADWLDETASTAARTGAPLPPLALAFTRGAVPAAQR
ncbi:hypothetical protein MUK60_07620 [Streptomyces sp. LRE541]|uniref:hypothetical protein n=1 Tax=Streptomyces sp. LRE541 TaxID=2931983 RepID=UPI0020109530|nr:hypothetical protein [Streptomyces sp. LRE541]UPZ27702.1 hypothetical protein MUK60_07620 [Streptomyces sp. LRE541]